MTTQKNKYPKAVYAVAGAGELAYEQLKKLPETATKLRNRVEVQLKKIDLAEVRGKVETEAKDLPVKVQAEAKDLRGKVQTELDTISGRVKTRVTELRGRINEARTKRSTDADKFRANAQDAVNGIVETAQKQLKTATKQATEVYEGLATRGAKVIGDTQPATKPAAPKATAPKATKTTKAAPKATKAAAK